MILAAQEQALTTNLIKHSIRPERHHCIDRVENPMTQYDTLSVDARGLPRMSMRVSLPLPIAENEEVRITWDMTIYTDKVLKHNRPDITLVYKDTQKWTLIGRAVIRTEEEKVQKYQELAFEIRRIHGASKVTVIPVVIGVLGSISKRAKTLYGKLGVPEFIGCVQLSTILGTAHLLRKMLCL